MINNESGMIMQADELRRLKLEQVYSRVEGISKPVFSFYVMICLSTIIAAYGLLSNSTAVVIGAMLVAPLMGPIFGIALSLSVDDRKLLGHSLIAEITGIIGVVLLGVLLGSIPYRPDFGSEIMARTTPNIYDIMIALASGFAGAYSFVDDKLSPALPGVAIATALVPPLTTCGLCLAYGRPDLAWGAFLLFFANFISIELAAAIVFFFAGIRKQGEKEAHTVIEFFRKFSFRIAILVLIGFFMTSTLVKMIRDKQFNRQVRAELSSDITKNTGSQLTDVKVSKSGSNYEIVATILTPREFDQGMVAQLENNLRKKLHLHINLVVRSLISRDMDRKGPAFIGEEEKQDMENRKIQKDFYDSVSRALAEQLTNFPGASLMDFVVDGMDEKYTITASIRTPVEITPENVGKIEEYLSSKMKKPIRLIVRSLISKDADSRRYLYESGKKEKEMSGKQLEFYSKLDSRLKELIRKQVKGAVLTEFRHTGESGDILVVADVRAPRVFDRKDVKSIEQSLKKTVSPGIFLVVRTTVGGDATSEGFVVDFNGKGLLPEQKKEDNE